MGAPCALVGRERSVIADPVGARYSATPLTCGDASPVRFGMIGVGDVAARVLIFCQLGAWTTLLGRSEASTTAEILVLRHQVSVLRRQVGPPQPSWADRALLSALARLLPKTRRRQLFVTPSTLSPWHSDVITRRGTT